MKDTLSVLFIGNSHTYFNDMPLMVRKRAEEAGFKCKVTMLAHPGWFLAQHAEQPDVRFNILFGGYDYVVLQEHAHPFGPVVKFHDAVGSLAEWIRRAGSVPVLYETWARKAEPEKQAEMDRVHRELSREFGALLAPVGENWREHMAAHPDIEMYYEDGAHASPAGSAFAAEQIFNVIRNDFVSRA